MKIPVEYLDGSFGYVEADRLEELIQAKKIMGFRRSDQWVRVRRDPVRGDGGLSKYDGPERRNRED